MEGLRRLVGLAERSELARSARLGLVGLRASLREAVQAAADDDAALPLCRSLLAELDGALGDAVTPSTRAEAGTDDSHVEDLQELFDEQARRGAAASSDLPAAEPSLRGLREDFTADAEARRHLGDFAFRATGEAELWGELHRALLRLPEPLARSWRERAAAAAAEAGARVDEQNVEALPFASREVLWPALDGRIRAGGLGLAPDAPLSPRLRGRPEPDSELHLLAQVVTVCLKFIEIDGALHHGLRSVYQFGVIPLESSQRQNYESKLLDLFERALAAEHDPVAALRARLDLDEAIHSLLYLPPAAPSTSWWARLFYAARQTLDGAAARVRRSRGLKVQIQLLLGPYPDIQHLTSNSVGVNGAGPPGQVLVCLRPYAVIGDEVLKGRVVHER